MNEFKFWLKHHNYEWKFKLAVCFPLFIVLIAFDWATKLYMQFGQTQYDGGKIIQGFIRWKYEINPGSAYGANADNVALAISLASIITLITAVIIIFLNDKKWLIAVVFIFAGSFANLIARSWAPAVLPNLGPDMDNRVVGQKGGVIDFLVWDFDLWGSNEYVFNIADLWVNIGVILLVIMLIVEVIITIINVKNSRVTKDLGNPEKILFEHIGRVKENENQVTQTKSEEIVYTQDTKDYNSMSKEEKKRFQREIKAKQKLEKLKEKR